MKPIPAAMLIAALSFNVAAFAQSGDMGGMKMTDKDTKRQAGATASHQADAVVKSVDVAQGKVTLSHDPIKSLGWPAMTMGFAVKNKALFDKLAVGKRVRVELEKDGAGYVVTEVR